MDEVLAESGEFGEDDDPGIVAQGQCRTPFFPPQRVIKSRLPNGRLLEVWRFQGFSFPLNTSVCPSACKDWRRGAIQAGFKKAILFRDGPLQGKPLLGGEFPRGSQRWDCILETNR